MKLKSKSKKEQNELLARIEAALSEPSKLVPDCIDGGMFCPFASYRKKLSAIESLEDYDKFSRSSDQFLKGLAESHEVLESNSVPMVGIFTTAYGSVEYAKRANADPSVLAGIQNSINPMWRMLAFYSLATNRDVRIFSSTNFYLASCKGSSPEQEFFADCLKDEKIAFGIGDAVQIGSGDLYFDVLYLGDRVMRIFESSTESTLSKVLKHILSKNPIKDFSFKFSFSDWIDLSREKALADYFAGKITDREFIRSARVKHIDTSMKGGAYVIGQNIFDTAEAFLQEFKVAPFDTGVLLPLIVERGGIKLDSPSIGKLLELLWPQYSERILGSLFPGAPLDGLKGNPLKQIETLQHRLQARNVTADIDVLAWSDGASLMLRLLKAYRADGRDAAVKEAVSSIKLSAKSEAVCYAFLVATDGLKGREWMFERASVDLGEKIRPIVENLLKAGGEAFSNIFESLKAYI